MKNNEQSNSRFQLSGRHPSEYPLSSNDDAMCVDIANALGESNMRFILARRHQLGMQAISDAYAVIKDEIRKGTCRNPRRLFNFLLTQKLEEKNQKINH
ncbi:MAG: hypothetical protein A2418_02190 [Candidatus Brennerbacteria bacterium RIFOXYC1_FULL_41_11]|uniref:Uncharacterized protein n=1 Tax=Candidatus Brennerbacteria bacterium RIFOXYD1_FULL_41_16 TaxID=1797529 RepID=A0A1G1XLH6_9BACT|nr:MAG: hypothetical protein A2418_02190 [Candidatus Brennerbacteria bacterium RIFOXYC1_FULL_41_11]OGY40764.1 MAG: hypothetical protein A2570_01400 [Candidatus Brennerbacteria bacterium RIFOXYD1_FULL_41_16]